MIRALVLTLLFTCYFSVQEINVSVPSAIIEDCSRERIGILWAVNRHPNNHILCTHAMNILLSLSGCFPRLHLHLMFLFTGRFIRRQKETGSSIHPQTFLIYIFTSEPILCRRLWWRASNILYGMVWISNWTHLTLVLIAVCTMLYNKMIITQEEVPAERNHFAHPLRWKKKNLTIEFLLKRN